MEPKNNPYTPGAGKPPRDLVGRDDLLTQMDIVMHRTLKGLHGNSAFLVGLRGVGKTVLLKRLVRDAEKMGYVSVYVEAPETSVFTAQLATKFRTAILSLQKNFASKAKKLAMGVLGNFVVTFPEGVSVRIDPDAPAGKADSGVLSEDLTDLVVATGMEAAGQGSGLIIAVDEVQYLKEEELAAVIVAIHRANQEELPVIFIGAGLPLLPRLVGEAKSYSERLFEFYDVRDLEPEAAKAALAGPAELSGAKIEEEALDKLVAVTRCYPYFIQVWGMHTWDVATGETITADDVAAAEPLAIATLDNSFFRVRMDRLIPSELKYLRAMAELGPGPHRTGDIANELSVKATSVAPRREKLIHKGMLYSPSHGEIAFTVPMFDEFLRRTLP